MTGSLRRSPFQVTTLAIGFLFFVNGIVFAAWATNIPFIQKRYELSEVEIGTVLLVMAGGAVCFMSMTSFFIQRLGSRLVSMFATQCFSLALAITFYMENMAGLYLSVVLLGAANGTMDVAMNQQAALYEAKLRRPIMSRLHGCFSVGALAGAVATYFAVTMGVTPFQQATWILVSVLISGLSLYSFLLIDKPSGSDRGDGFSIGAFKNPTLLVLGFFSFLTMMSEGAIADWSALFLIDYSGLAAGVATLGFATYASLMIVGRLSGDGLTLFLGHRTLVQVSGSFTCVGILFVLFGNTVFLQFLGLALLGFGIANLVPVVFSNAAKLETVRPSSGIAFVSVAGYSGFLVGPALIGWLASLIGLDKSLLVVLIAGLTFVMGSRIFPAKKPS